MNFLKKLWGKGTAEKPAPALSEAAEPVVDHHEIQRKNAEEWISRLEREGNRTGNAALLRQASNIRARLAPQ